MWQTNTIWFETTVVLGIFTIGGILFGHFEEHKAKWRRVLKVFIVLAVVLGLSSRRAEPGRSGSWRYR